MTLMHSTVIMVTRNKKIIMKIIIMTGCKIRRNKGSHSSHSHLFHDFFLLNWAMLAFSAITSPKMDHFDSKMGHFGNSRLNIGLTFFELPVT